MPKDIWSHLVAIIPQKEYTDTELRAILRDWCRLLEDSFTIPHNRGLIRQEMNSALEMLKAKAKQDGVHITLETLRYLLHKDHFTVEELNKCLVAAGIPYHYVRQSDDLLKEGKFEMGFEENDKFDCVFISHAYADREINNLFVDLLEDIGLKRGQIFYSSLPEYGVDLGENIADAIRIRLSSKIVHMIYMLSKNYYKSVMCLNEMGAAWILQHTYTSVLLPGFKYKKIKGAVDPGILGMNLGGDEVELKSRLIRLRNQLQNEFCLPSMDEIMWNRKVDNFIKVVKEKTDH